MDRLPAHRLEAADESVTEVGAAAAANRVGPPFLGRHVCRTMRLSHQHPSGCPIPLASCSFSGGDGLSSDHSLPPMPYPLPNSLDRKELFTYASPLAWEWTSTLTISPSRCGPVLFATEPGNECKAICEGSSGLLNGKTYSGSLKQSEQPPPMVFTLC
jgi:hypothetical protein